MALVHVSNLGDTDGVAPIKVILQPSLGVTFVESTATDWTCAATGPVVICTYAAILPAGAALPDLTLTWAIGPYEIVKDEIRICAELRVESDVNPNNNNVCEVYTPLVPTASYDVLIEKTLWSSSSPNDEIVSYVIVVTNLGPDPVFDPITVTDTLPTGLSVVSYATSLGVSCGVPTPASLECGIAYLGTAMHNKTKTIQVQAAIAPAVSGTVTNCAHVSAAQDFQLANNDSCCSFERGAPAPFDLQVTGVVTNPPSPGMTGQYHFFLHNAGPNGTTQQLQVLLDAPPPGATLSYVSGIDGEVVTSTNTGNCAPVAGTAKISCPMSVLIPSGATHVVWMTFWLDPGATGAAPACLSIDPLGDTNAANNQACLALPAMPITGSYSLTTKLSAVGPPTAGTIGALSLAVENKGSVTSPDPTLAAVILPPSVAFVGVANAPMFDCTATKAATGETIVTCRHKGGMLAGARATIPVALYYESAGDVTVCSEVSPRLMGSDPLQTRSCAVVPVAP